MPSVKKTPFINLKYPHKDKFITNMQIKILRTTSKRELSALNLGTQYLFFKIHLYLRAHKKTEQPRIRQPGYDGAGNPAISVKSAIYS